ncbi:ClpP-like prohead protease/major capsid protein fusion protein [Klebsiella aerogenes]|uniref:ClpP-like prohead protease/major capsid protein fusion protein n=1 Tax=Klebsiella aerogenes TaxID=548 RepID=UPI002E30C6D6|nr:ClpP-like prohead protease/major capsid protein fusion protein [Klebsiella aerogenes]
MEIAIYEPITGDTAKRFRDAMAVARGPVTVAINSGGGNVTDGLAILNSLRAYKGHTVARIDGIAASMATIVALGAKSVAMADNGWFMVHNPWAVTGGESGDLRRMADVLDANANAMVGVYAGKTGLPEDEIRSLMDAETWLTAEEAKEKGFIDEIYPAEDMALGMAEGCYAMFGQYQNAPEAVKKLMVSDPTKDKPEDVSRVFSGSFKADVGEVQQIKARYEMGGVTLEDARAVLQFLDSCSGYTDVDSAPIRQQLIAGQITLPQARQEFLAEMAKGITPGAGGYAHINAHNGNIVGDSVRAAIEARIGLKEAEKDNRYNGYTLKELARASLQDRNISISGKNVVQMVGMAFTHSSSDFSFILQDVANKSMLQGWSDSPETFDKWTRAGNLPDFKPGHRVGLDTFPRLREVRPGAEYKYATIGEKGEKIILATYGELFSIDRQSIINDDLSVLSTIPMSMGRAAKATIGDLVYAVLQTNPALSDGVQLFSDEHNNYFAGELSVETLSSLRSQMRLQKSQAGQVLNIVPKFLIVPAVQESLAEQIIRSISIPGTMNSGVHNPVKDSLDIIVEPRLDGVDEDAWYLAAAQGSDTIEVAYLDGNATPYLDSTEGFTVDGMTYKVRIDAGVAPMDYRGLMKSDGKEPAS